MSRHSNILSEYRTGCANLRFGGGDHGLGGNREALDRAVGGQQLGGWIPDTMESRGRRSAVEDDVEPVVRPEVERLPPLISGQVDDTLAGAPLDLDASLLPVASQRDQVEARRVGEPRGASESRLRHIRHMATSLPLPLGGDLDGDRLHVGVVGVHLRGIQRRDHESVREEVWLARMDALRPPLQFLERPLLLGVERDLLPPHIPHRRQITLPPPAQLAAATGQLGRSQVVAGGQFSGQSGGALPHCFAVVSHHLLGGFL